MTELTPKYLIAQGLTFTSALSIANAVFGLVDKSLTTGEKLGRFVVATVVVGGTVLASGTLLDTESSESSGNGGVDVAPRRRR